MPIRNALHTILSLSLLMTLSSFSLPGKNGNAEKTVPMKTAEAETRNTAFALDLYHTLGKSSEGNLFFSPYSVSTALSMTLVGAAGNTEKQIADILQAPQDITQYHNAQATFEKNVERVAEQGNITLETANSLWPQKGYELSKTFLHDLHKCYGTAVTPVDYRMNTEKARKTINRWVEKKTQDKIRELLTPGILNSLTRLTLVNAVYFKGSWEKQFDTSKTVNTDFFISKETKTVVPMMHQEKSFRYAASDSLQILELPYSEDDLSMLVLLPAAKDGLALLESSLTPERLDTWTNSLKHRKVSLFLPKFTMTSTLRLDSNLKALGMTDAFDPDKADFSKMTVAKDKLFIGAVVHKAFVDVNEEGTEAAAATGVVIGITSAMPEPVTVFRADHPFLVIIKEKSSGSILFMGRVVEPSSD